MATILYVDDDPTIGLLLEDTLLRAGHRAIGARSVPQALQALSHGEIELIISDFKMPGMTGLEFLGLLKEEAYDIPLIMVTGYASIEHAVLAIKAGASDYITKPVRPEQLEHAVTKALQVARLRKENDVLRQEVMALRNERQIIGESGVMRRLLQTVATAAPTRATVLLQGESGTGKELVARALHYRSERADNPLVEVNCSQFQEALLNNELFGHERGAFTDAREVKKGLVELCDRGTLFLDEVGEMPLGTQAMLLRFIDQRQFKRVGGTENIAVNLRIVTATNKRLDEEVQKERFRGDLLYRLKVVSITMPPLRERGQDVVLLTEHFLREFAGKFKKSFSGVSPEAADFLVRYSWPGNVRQLRNLVERIVLLEKGPTLGVEHLPQEIVVAVNEAPDGPRPGSLSLAEIEERHIRQVIRMTEGNKSRAARILGISRPTLIEKLKRMEFDVKERDM
jgi:DNA-binding NtrC family response regulator